MMWLLRLVFFFLIVWNFSEGSPFQQHRYIVIQDNITLTDINTDIIDAEAGIYKLNATTNALDLKFTLKTALPADAKVIATAYRWMNNEYRFCMIQIQKSLKSALNMEVFDIDSLVLRYSRPPIVWPIEKGVTYHARGWSPDSTMFPANLPEGLWKVPIVFSFANKTKIIVATWYLRLKYLK